MLADGLLAMALVLSFNHPWEHPTDFPDATVMTMAVWAAIRRRFDAAVCLATVGAANRESAAFVGIIWIAITLGDLDSSRVRRVAQGLALVAVTIATTTILRLVFELPGGRVRNSVAENDVWAMLKIAVAHPFLSWAMLLIAMLIGPVVLVAANWSPGSAEGRRLAVAGAAIGLVSVVIGAPNELRVLVPAVTVLICAGSLLAPRSELVT